MVEDPRKFDIRRFLAFFWEGRILLLIAAALGVLGFGYHAFYVASPIYQATTTVILETRREQLVDVNAVIAGLTGEPSEINTEIEVLRSRILMDRVADELALIEDPEFNKALTPDSLMSRVKHWILSVIPGLPPRPAGVDRIRESVTDALLSHVTITAIPSSYVFRIRAKSNDPVKAALIADTIARIYVTMQIEAKENATRDAIVSLSVQVDELQAELFERESAIAAFAAAHDLSGERIEGDLSEARDALRAARGSLDRLVLRAADLAKATAPDAQARIAGDDTLNLILERIGEADAPAAFSQRLAEVNDIIIAEIAETETEIDDLEQQIAALEESLDQSRAAQREHARNLREAEATRALYDDFLTRLKETTAHLGMIQPDARVLSAAVVPNVHSEPRRTQLLTIGLVFGLVAGAVVLLAKDAMVVTFSTSRDLVAATGHPVLGQVPVIPTSNGAGTLRYLAEKPTSTAAEAVRGLRISLFNDSEIGPPKIILLTPAQQGDGATTVAIALAQNLAAVGKSVVLVDGDMRQSAFDDIFGAGTGKGLMSVLAEDAMLEEALFAVDPFGFEVLKGNSGAGPGNPDILSSDRFSDLVALLSDTYDVVLIDAPPVLAVPDARILGRLVHRIILVIRAGETTRSQTSDGLQLLDSLGPLPATLVLNRAGASV
jgi:succinoglycan biosynthesis transport protein ExoP